jgi:hypothetical protein
MSVFRALAFPFEREHRILFLYVTILNLIWIASIVFASLIFSPRDASIRTIPLTYGFSIFALGFSLAAFASRIRGEAALPLPKLFTNIRQGLIVGLATLLYNAPTIILFWLWWHNAQAELSFGQDSVLPTIGSRSLFIWSFGLFVFLIAFLGGASFLRALLRFATSGNLKELFDLRGNFSQISWRLLPYFNLFMSFFIVWVTSRIFVSVFTLFFNQLVSLLILLLGYDSPFGPVGFVCRYTALGIIDFATLLAYIWLLVDYAQKSGVVIRRQSMVESASDL